MQFVNLDLGATVWLNIPKRLAQIFTHFFNQGDVPKPIVQELLHHSHTHPNWSGTSASTSHDHFSNSGATNCGYPGASSHQHGVKTDLRNPHSHALTLAFASANLGVPWYNHVHAISLVSMDTGGVSHYHGWLPLSEFSYCVACEYEEDHSHSVVTGSTSTNAYAHTHTIPTVNTGTAIPSDTPENHRHNFSFYTLSGGSHTHTVVSGGSLSSASCAFGKTHTHTAPSSIFVSTHEHSVSGTTGYGGEPVGPVVTIVSLDFPTLYLPKPVKAEELVSKVEGATVTKIANDFPEKLLKSGKAQELRSKFAA